MKVIDFDCGDYFTVVIMETGEYEFDAQMYRDFKYSANQKIILKISENKEKKLKNKIDEKKKLEEESESSVDSIFQEKGLYTIEGEINTKYIQNYILRENTVFNFNKAILKKRPKKNEKITLENLEERVKEFFGIIDFTKLPVHLLSLEEPIRRKDLRNEVKKLIDELCYNSKDFKGFMKNFNKAIKISNANPNISFEDIFYKEILKENIVKKVLPKKKKRKKEERKFYYRKGEKILLNEEESSKNTDTRTIYAATALTRFSSAYQSSNNPFYPKKKKEKIDPIKTMIDRRYSTNKIMKKPRPPSSFSTVRIKRIKHSKVSKINYDVKSKEAQERINTLFFNKGVEVEVKEKQKTIQTMANLTRAKIYKKKRRKDIIVKLQKKHNKPRRLDEKKLMEKEKKIKFFKSWQKQWITFLILGRFVKGIGKIAGDLDEYHKIHTKTQVIQKFWRIRRCNHKIGELTLVQKIYFAWAARKLKEKVKNIRKRNNLRHTMNYLILNSIRKKARIGVSRMVNKVKE